MCLVTKLSRAGVALFALGLSLLLGAIPWGCSKQGPVNIDRPLALYRLNRLEKALPMLEKAAAEHPRDARTTAWLAEAYLRLSRKGDAIRAARQTLANDTGNCIAHTVLAYAFNPLYGAHAEADAESAWVHASSAVQCDSSDGNAWLALWPEAIRRGESNLGSRALRKLIETGFLTKPALAYGRWMLGTLPAGALLITNGDMDTFPALAIQDSEGFRRDVVVVARGFLNVPWFLRYLRDVKSFPLPIEDTVIDRLHDYRDLGGTIVSVSDQVFRDLVQARMRGAVERPLAVALTVSERFLLPYKSQFRYAGPFLYWVSSPSSREPDIVALRASLESVRPEDFSGPWVSEQDRSPVRRAYTKEIVATISTAGLAYCGYLIEKGRFDEAATRIAWVEEFQKKTELGPVMTEEIEGLKNALKHEERR